MSNVCERCGKSNRDNAMFCIGCAGKLPGFVASGPSALEKVYATRKRGTDVGLSTQAGPGDVPHREPPVLSRSSWLLMGLLFAAVVIGSLTWLLQAVDPGVSAPGVQARIAVEHSKAVEEPAIDLQAAAADATPRPPWSHPQEAANASQVQSVESFYRALSAADGKAAAALVVPEKRGIGPYNEASITKFYGSFERPLVLHSVRALDAHRVEAKYSYRISRRTCEGTAIVETERLREKTLIRSIRANC